MKKIKLENKIFEKIEKGELKMKPKWKFWVIMAGIKTSTVLVILMASIIFAWVVWMIERLQPEELWEYGDLGREIFLADFPYLLIGGGVSLIITAGILFSKIDDNYKIRSRIIGLVIALIILIATILFSYIRWRYGFNFDQRLF